MLKAETAVKFMEQIANDNTHGYDQTYRWGEHGDYDCSALVITAWKNAGVNTGASYTGDMLNAFKKHGFADVTSKCNLDSGRGLVRGDVLLVPGHHTAMYCGNGYIVDARINENGKTTGGAPGDQTGHEIEIHKYYNRPWRYVLRYTEKTETASSVTYAGGKTVYNFSVKSVYMGTTGNSTRLLQEILVARNIGGANGRTLAIDGDCGKNTVCAINTYQEIRRSAGVEIGTNGKNDGCCGAKMWADILGL